MSANIRRWALVTMASAALVGCGKKESLVQRFPGPWKTGENERLTKLLDANKVTCAAPHWRTYHNEPSTELLVYCSPDGKTWNAYLVWGSIKKVMGPLEPFADIPPPSQ